MSAVSCQWLIAIVVLIGMIGCDNAPPAVESPAALPRYEPGNAIVRGKVSFIGTPPAMETIANQPCHADAGPLVEETVVVSADGGLKNVFVYVKNGPKTDGSAAEPAMLDQVNCRYVPHVVGVQVGQKLVVRSSDPTMHNVHYNPRHNAAGNFGMTGAGQERPVTFAKAEFIPVKCDVHPWMTAHIGVFDNPLFARTDDDGTYEIAGLKPGKYTLATWHERYGELTNEIEITDAATEVADFEYSKE